MSEAEKSTSRWVLDTSEETFARDVFDRSQERPVVVDFWAEWCAPCRLLGPILERIAAEYDGRFVLVKAETDRLPRAASEFRVSGIPAVYAVVGGEVVDFFQGALPEEAIREWLDRVLLFASVAEAKRLEAEDPAAAEAKYRELTKQLPNESEVQIGLVRTLLAQQRKEECRQQIELLEQRGFLEPEAEKIKAELELESLPDVNIEQARLAAEAAPDDLEKQLVYAEALIGSRQYEPALEICLAIVESDRGALRDKAKQLMVDLFRVLSDDDPLVSTYRRKLSTALY